MNSLINKLSILAALMTLTTAGAAFAADAPYNNIITLERYEAALTDQRDNNAEYRNIIDLDRFELALVDQREIDGWYKNTITRDNFLANLGDPCMTEEGDISTTLMAYCEVK